MSTVYHIDFETYSACDLKKAGAYRYAADPSTRILMMAIAREGEEPHLWIHPDHREACPSEPGADELLLEIEETPGAILYAHNAQFEMALTRYRWAADVGTTPPAPEMWRCTATMARMAALPPSLEKCAEALNLDMKKDKEGSRLIKKFSCPQKPRGNLALVLAPFRFMPEEDADDFVRFAEYCLQDVRTEQAIHTALKPFELAGAMEEAFMFDSKLNDRGIPINVKALKNAVRIVEAAGRDLSREFQDLTGLLPTQGKAFLAWLQQRGYPYDNLQAGTVEKALADTTWADATEDLRALELKSQLSFAAVSKLYAMLLCDCGDGYVRGTLRFYGAGTGRWSGQLIQPQNFKRPTIKDTEGAYQMICDGCTRDELEAMYGNPIEVVASCIRHFLQPHTGLFLNADYAAVEARIVCWLAGQEDALEEYRRGVDRYVSMASAIYNRHPEDVSKHERWVGKQAVLGCGFSMWVDAFQAQCAKYGVNMAYEDCERAVNSYREVHHHVVDLWESFEKAAKSAIATPGKWFRAGPKCKFGCTVVAGIKYLVMMLPSGRRIVYPHVKMEMVKRTSKAGRSRMVEQITFWAQIPGKAFWGRISTYGGKLVENATQGTAFDLMANGACRAEERGFELTTLIHDEALAFHKPGQTAEEFIEALCDLPEWAAGMPLAAEGGFVKYYQKD